MSKTESKRLQISLRMPMYELIDRMAFLTSTPRSKVITELLEPCYMPLVRTVALLEAAQAAPDEIKHGLKTTIEDLETEIVSLTGLAERETTRLYDIADSAVEVGETYPLSTNRGVEISNPLKNNKKQKRAKRGKK